MVAVQVSLAVVFDVLKFCIMLLLSFERIKR